MKAFRVVATTLALLKPPRPSGRTELRANGFRLEVNFSRKWYLPQVTSHKRKKGCGCKNGLKYISREKLKNDLISERAEISNRHQHSWAWRISSEGISDCSYMKNSLFIVSHLFPTSLKANEWTVLQATFLGKRRCASMATDLLKATYRKRRCGRCSAYFTSVVVFPVPGVDSNGHFSYSRIRPGLQCQHTQKYW